MVKRLCMLVVVAGLLMSTAYGAVHVSTFQLDKADLLWYGFNPVHSGYTDGTNFIELTNMTGTYNLDIPPAGSGPWPVYVGGPLDYSWVDYDKDGTWDGTDGPPLPVTYIGDYLSSGPKTSWGPGSLPFDLTFDPGGGDVTLSLTLGFDIDLDGPYPSGPYGTNAYANFTISGSSADMTVLNGYLTLLDYASGGGDGEFDWWVSSHTTVTAVPEPLSMLLFGGSVLGGLGAWRRRRRMV